MPPENIKRTAAPLMPRVCEIYGFEPTNRIIIAAITTPLLHKEPNSAVRRREKLRVRIMVVIALQIAYVMDTNRQIWYTRSLFEVK
jgi:hypothetical protein